MAFSSKSVRDDFQERVVGLKWMAFKRDHHGAQVTGYVGRFCSILENIRYIIKWHLFL